MIKDPYLSANARIALYRAQLVLVLMPDDPRSELGLHVQDAIAHLQAAFELLEAR